MSIEEMMDLKIKKLLEEIDQLEPGSEERVRAVKNVTELMKAKTEQYKAEMDISLRDDQFKLERDKADREAERLEKQADYEKERDVIIDRTAKRNRKVDIGIRVGEFVLGGLAYGAMYMIGLKFEETNVLRSPIFRNFWSSIKPPKKK